MTGDRYDWPSRFAPCEFTPARRRPETWKVLAAFVLGEATVVTLYAGVVVTVQGWIFHSPAKLAAGIALIILALALGKMTLNLVLSGRTAPLKSLRER